MAIPLENIKSYVDALVAAGGTNADIKAAMDLYGVSSGQLAAAYNADPAIVQAEYNRVQASPASRIQTFEQTGAAPTAQPNLRGQATSFPEGTGTPSTGPVGGTVRTTTSQPSNSIAISPESFNPAGTLTLTGAPTSLTPSATPATTTPVATPAVSEAGTVSTLGTTTSASTSRLSPDQISVVQNFVNAAMQNNPENWVGDVTRRMDEVGLPPDMLQQVYPNLSLQQIQQAYNQSRPGGMFATPDTTPDPLARAAGESRIDPVIAPYLSEALGQARSLFLTGQGPQLYPGQMFVSPSAETLESLGAQTDLARMATPFYQQAAEGLDVGLRGLETTASGAFLGGSPYRDAMISAATRPLTQQFTEEVMPGIQSTFSQAGRLGSGAQGAVTGRATEGFTRALGDVTSRIAAEDYARERGFQEEALRDVISGASNLGNVYSSFLAPSTTLANVGAQREAIAGQPLAESMRRFDYAQNLPQEQFAKYMASIYGSPLGTMTAGQPQPQGNTTLQNIGDLFSVAGGIPKAIGGVKEGYDFISGLFK